MSDARVTSRLAEGFWLGLGLVSLATLFFSNELQVVPFHVVWVAVIMLYGLRTWSVAVTVAVVVAASGLSAAALIVVADESEHGYLELLEIPMMLAVFAAMAWHVARRRAAAAQVEAAARRERDFVLDVSHQLRTPITIARGHAELVRAEAGEPDVVADTGVVIDELDRLARMSERLLLLATPEHAELLDRRPIELEELVASVARRWGPAAKRQWRIDAGHDGMLTADAEKLALAFDALIENAVRFTGDDDVITIEGRIVDGQAELAVCDTGPGIPPELEPRLFERYARDPAGGGGSGLGLATVKAVAEAHGGSVSVKSEPGNTRFSMRIPLG